MHLFEMTPGFHNLITIVVLLKSQERVKLLFEKVKELHNVLNSDNTENCFGNDD